MNNKSGTDGPAISLPKGGGAVKGIGETFQPNLFTGTGNFSIPLVTSPGRGGFGPQLTLQYSTGTGNGPFGLGWQLSLPCITRKTEKGLPRYSDEDVFVLSGAEDLVICDQQPAPGDAPLGYRVTRFRPRTEGLFARIEQWKRHGDGDVHWRATTRDNITNLYGKSGSARIADPSDSTRVFQWLLEESFDSKGNHILYEYIKESPAYPRDTIFEDNRQHTRTYIRRILYGNTPDSLSETKRVGPMRTATDHQRHRDQNRELTRHYLFEVVFDYGDLPEIFPIPHPQLEIETTIPPGSPVRKDRFSTFRAGFEIRTLRRCRRVLMLHHFDEGELVGAPLVKSTNFSYQVDPNTHLSLLTAVNVHGYRKGAEGSYTSATLPPVEFTYSRFEPEKQRYQSITAEGDDLPPRSLNAPGFALVDLFGDALPDIVCTSETGYDIWRNLGDGSLERRRLQRGGIPPVSLSQTGVAFSDFGGDGLPDLMVQTPSLSGFFEATPDGQWQPFRRFARFPSVNFNDPNLRIVDLTGDGLPDILITRANHFLWFRCLGEAGYAEPEAIARVHDPDAFPDVYFNDPDGRVRLADMTGDGLNDIVFIHDGRIEYWPNLGYGRFGRRVIMADAPRIGYGFDPRRLFLVDLDGSGCADIAYVDADCVQFWFNRSGNSWSERHTIRGTPPVTDLTAIQFADFFGAGTAALVWSYDYAMQRDGNYKVLDFCGGEKPYLLSEVKNNLGATTRVQYAPSTKFYLEDKANGRPWITSVPFPVQVVEKVEVIDHISRTKLVTTYKYHHGYYDGREREFRGFGRVDQFDSEIFERFSTSGLHGEETVFDNTDPAFHQPPVETRTWFHTGIYFDPDRHLDHRELTQRYQEEYYGGDAQAFGLPDHDFEKADGTHGVGSAPHAAFRALRGAILRSEVYSRDGADRQMHPYVVTESRYRVKELQEAHDVQHGVYFTSTRERFTFHYERNPVDPRIGHELTLAADEFGNVTRTAAVGYPRRIPEHAEQERTLITYAEADFINAVNEDDWYRVGVPCETRTLELTGLTRAYEHRACTVEEIKDAAAHASILPYEAEPNLVTPQKRLLDATRTFYLRDDLTGPLPLGEVESHALPYEVCRMAYTSGLVTQVYADRVDDRLLVEEGRYTKGRDLYLSGDLRDDAWWTPSGRQRFSAADFYLPVEYTDPFGNTSHTAYDDYRLMIREVHDPVDNAVTVLNDYRVLQPWQITDPNGNRSQVAFDVLGLVVGTAVMGKEGETVGDSLTDFSADLSEAVQLDHIRSPLVDPHAILRTATTRLIYDLFAYQRSRNDPQPQPAVVYTLARETHAADLPPGEQTKIQHSFSYSDGFGREIHKKIQAEPGPMIEGGPDASPRWVGSGWTILNNKGKPVRQYEPFFSATHTFEFARTEGVSPMLYYDPLGRVVATLHPNHTWEKVVFDPWRQETWDVSDTVLQADPKADPDVGDFFWRLPAEEYLPTWHTQGLANPMGTPERAAADRAAVHADTPTVAHFDTLSRTFLTIAHNRFKRSDALAADPPTEEFYSTRSIFDIEGNQRAVIDAKDRIVMRYDYDLLGNRIFQASMEAGERWLLNDVSGKPIYVWDSRGHRFRTEYDALRRPARAYVQGGDPSNLDREILFGRTEYGEGQTDDTTLNLRTQVFRQFDSTGIATNEEYDFKSNLLRGSRQLIADYQTAPDWSAAPTLEPEVFTSHTTYDALNRPVTLTTPDNSVIHPTYNEANLLERLEANLRGSAIVTHFVSNINYNAKGQRTLIEYDNGVQTQYAYDPQTFRLTRMCTLRSTEPVQDLSYDYDPVGNITHIRDDAQQTIYFRNRRVEPSADYTYDAMYRLIEATGREHLGQNGSGVLPPAPTSHTDAPRVGLLHPGDGNAMGRYLQRYVYDEVGNFLEMIHHGTDPAHPGWRRVYTYNEDSLLEADTSSNRLSCTTLHPNGNHRIIENYTHDVHGNMTSMPHLVQIAWNLNDQLQQVNLGGGGTAWYVYDAAGRRVRKVIERHNGARHKERIYLGGFEVYREYTGEGADVALERETLHIMDDKQCIALVETRTQGNDGSSVQLTRYQLGNHLGSACLELDSEAQIISYEEYYPYGSTSYQAVRSQTETPKRYRYTGMERDEETGLNYHGARYYAPWLGRWSSCDPMGIADGPNVYGYVGDNPMRSIDPTGTGRFSLLGESLSPPQANPELQHLLVDVPVPGETSSTPLTAPESAPASTTAPSGARRSPNDWIPVAERWGAGALGVLVGGLDAVTAGLYSRLLEVVEPESMEAIRRISTFEAARVSSEVTISIALMFTGVGFIGAGFRGVRLAEAVTAEGLISSRLLVESGSLRAVVAGGGLSVLGGLSLMQSTSGEGGSPGRNESGLQEGSAPAERAGPPQMDQRSGLAGEVAKRQQNMPRGRGNVTVARFINEAQEVRLRYQAAEGFSPWQHGEFINMWRLRFIREIPAFNILSLHTYYRPCPWCEFYLETFLPYTRITYTVPYSAERIVSHFGNPEGLRQLLRMLRAGSLPHY